MCTKVMSGSHFGVKPICVPAILPRALVSIGRTPGGVNQAGATANPKRCPAWLVRELDSDDGALWQLGVLQAEPQKI